MINLLFDLMFPEKWGFNQFAALVAIVCLIVTAGFALGCVLAGLADWITF